MEPSRHPTFGHGKICYLEIPAYDVDRSAEFYRVVFGWRIMPRGDGAVSFDDGVGEVSGMWVTGRQPATSPTLMVHIMVEDAERTLGEVVKNGGAVVQAIGADLPEITARFRDPAGNVLGIYQHGGKAG